mmetsp:Transcript_4146/g.16069  ORF Transcript_4146/g.16069 Transcript_4146/m.16069 type:complete len:258 (+) Transcript_4146:1687-2460(+)
MHGCETDLVFLSGGQACRRGRFLRSRLFSRSSFCLPFRICQRQKQTDHRPQLHSRAGIRAFTKKIGVRGFRGARDSLFSWLPALRFQIFADPLRFDEVSNQPLVPTVLCWRGTIRVVETRCSRVQYLGLAALHQSCQGPHSLLLASPISSGASVRQAVEEKPFHVCHLQLPLAREGCGGLLGVPTQCGDCKAAALPRVVASADQQFDEETHQGAYPRSWPSIMDMTNEQVLVAEVKDVLQLSEDFCPDHADSTGLES